MIARFDWQWQFSSPISQKERPSRLSYRVGGIMLGGVTAVYLFWILIHYLIIPNEFASLPAILRELFRLLEMAGGVTLVALWSVWFWQWKRPFVSEKNAHKHTLDDLYALSPQEFEEYVALLFRKKGYIVHLRGSSGDMGVDLEIEQRGGKRAIVQCKRYRRPVGPDVVRELFGTLIHERVSHAFLVTTADISKSARKWAQDKPMTLIDGDLLVKVSESLVQNK